MGGRPLSVRPLLLRRGVFGSLRTLRPHLRLSARGQATDKGAATRARPLRAYAGAADSQRASSAPPAGRAARGPGVLADEAAGDRGSGGRRSATGMRAAGRAELDIFRYGHILRLVAR